MIPREGPESTYRIINYPTTQQRMNIKLEAWQQMFHAMEYNPETRTYTATELALTNAGIPCPHQSK